MKHCFNGYRFPGVGTDTDDGLYNAQLCVSFLDRLCEEENLRWLDPSDDEHWAKLTDKNALLDRMNDDNCDPSWAMLELLARSGKAAADDLVVLANNGSLKHSKALLEQRYPIKDLLDNSHFLEERDAAAATRNFMYDMGLRHWTQAEPRSRRLMPSFESCCEENYRRSGVGSDVDVYRDRSERQRAPPKAVNLYKDNMIWYNMYDVT